MLPITQRLPDARFKSTELTPTRLYLKVVTPRVQIEIQPGDIIQAGVVIQQLRGGQGTLSVQPLVYRLICRNGLIAADRAMRKTARGTRQRRVLRRSHGVQGRHPAGRGQGLLPQRCATWSRPPVSEATFQQIAEKMRRTMGIRLKGDPVRTIEVVGTRYLLNEGERSGLLRHLIEGGDLSAYGLVNAVTHYAQDVDDYSRDTSPSKGKCPYFLHCSLTNDHATPQPFGRFLSLHC
ncbi:MAG: DUF932 domain-containing protein [Rubrivivax sp.]|nr:DUF932 domain-containing protein [Rubrivivax sp.]